MVGIGGAVRKPEQSDDVGLTAPSVIIVRYDMGGRIPTGDASVNYGKSSIPNPATI